MVTEESTKETVKTIARGMPGFSGEPVVTTLVCFILFRTRDCGCSERPAFPAPSVFFGRTVFAKLGRIVPRECAVVFEMRRHCDCLRMAAPRVARKGEAWWGRKDSNLRSHEAADLQSAPFATRDTSPLNSIATRP